MIQAAFPKLVCFEMHIFWTSDRKLIQADQCIKSSLSTCKSYSVLLNGIMKAVSTLKILRWLFQSEKWMISPPALNHMMKNKVTYKVLETQVQTWISWNWAAFLGCSMLALLDWQPHNGDARNVDLLSCFPELLLAAVLKSYKSGGPLAFFW